MKKVDVLILGAGAAGLMCAIESGKRGRKVLVIDHANKPGKKILMSGGGRCNFTNYSIEPKDFTSNNPHFCKSALSRYTQWNFIELVQKHQIPFHEKSEGQLFCDNKAKDIVNMLLSECSDAGVEIQLETHIESITKKECFYIKTHQEEISCTSLVVATGGLSIPTMGASPFGYKIAEQFGIKVWPTRAGLVPLTLHESDKNKISVLSGVSLDVLIHTATKSFEGSLLFTHRGLSGPVVLQLSSHWQPGEQIAINLLPKLDLLELIAENKNSQQQLKSIFSEHLPKRVIETLLDPAIIQKKPGAVSRQELNSLHDNIANWRMTPNGTEGYRTAEVTLGGVDCDALSSKTMEANSVSGLYFIGEVVDVAGKLGGFNFQWAWSSGWAAGQVA